MATSETVATAASSGRGSIKKMLGVLPRNQLADLANVGPATLRDFEVLGIWSVAELAKRQPFTIYRTLRK